MDLGDEIESAARAELTAEKAYQKILRLCTVRERSTLQIRERLQRDGYSEDMIEEALGRALSYRFIDDNRYADALIRSALASNRGLEKVLRELEELGLDPEELESYQEYISQGEEAEIDRAMSFLEHHPPTSKNQRNGAFQKLVKRGFSTGIASEVAHRWSMNQRL